MPTERHAWFHRARRRLEARAFEKLVARDMADHVPGWLADISSKIGPDRLNPDRGATCEFRVHGRVRVDVTITSPDGNTDSETWFDVDYTQANKPPDIDWPGLYASVLDRHRTAISERFNLPPHLLPFEWEAR